MYVALVVLLSVGLFYLVCLAAGFVIALLIARHEIRQHNERWRFG
jgi:hypothetical protein